MEVSFFLYLRVSLQYCTKTTSGSNISTENHSPEISYKLSYRQQAKLKRSTTSTATTLIISWPLVVPTGVKKRKRSGNWLHLEQKKENVVELNLLLPHSLLFSDWRNRHEGQRIYFVTFTPYAGMLNLSYVNQILWRNFDFYSRIHEITQKA